MKGGPLPRRQREVAQLLVEGRTNAEIAAAMWVSLDTVKTHIRLIRERLRLPAGETTRVQLARRLIDDGWVSS